MTEIEFDKKAKSAVLKINGVKTAYQKRPWGIWVDNHGEQFPDLTYALLSYGDNFDAIFSDDHDNCPYNEKIKAGKIYLIGWNCKPDKSSIIIFDNKLQVRLQQSCGFWHRDVGKVTHGRWVEKKTKKEKEKDT